MSNLPNRPLQFAEIVDGAFQLYRRDFLLYFLTSALVYAVFYVVSLPLTPIVALLVGFVGWLVAGVVVTTAIRERICGRDTTPWSACVASLSSVLSAGGATLIVAILCFIVFFIVILVVFVAGVFVVGGGSPTALLPIVMGLGFVGALFAQALLFGIVPAVVLEGAGPWKAVRRWVYLCRGGWVRVMAVTLVVTIITAGPSAVGAFVLGGINFFEPVTSLDQVTATDAWLSNTIESAVGSLLTPFAAGSILLLFHDRRIRRDGTTEAAHT